LRQIGIDATDILAESPGLTWVSITGHGSEPPASEWIGFGDDAAASAGLCHAMAAAHGAFMFCGDAIADPLTGLHAAVAAWASWLSGGGRKIDLSLRGVSVHCAVAGATDEPVRRVRDWAALVERAQPAMLALPVEDGVARVLGADTQAVLSGLGVAC
jgi:crotonobetainyl-CoA:carnitine CoA-transferase CaiB-like acyl-CoA transferase